MGLAAKNAKSAKKAWPMVRLGDVCKFQRGLTYKKSDEVAQSENIVLRSNNIDLEQGVLDLRELKCIREDLFVPDDKKVIPGSILMCMANGSKSHLGKVALVQDDLGYAFGGFMGLLVPEGVDSSYLYLALRSAPFKECIRKLQDGANINNLKFSDFCDFPIPLPPLSVQREIVARLEKELGEADALAAKFKGIAENADAEFKAELDETFKNVEGEKVRLGDVCEFLTDGDWIESKDQSENGVRLIQTGNVGNGVFKAKESNAHYISEETFERLKCTEIFNGDVLVSRLPSPVGRACIVNGIEGRMITAVDCSIIRFKDVVVKEYFVAYSQTQGYQAAIDVLTTGTTRARISRKNLASIPVPLLPLSVQCEIVTKLDVARERCDKLKLAAERGLRAAEDLRKAILAEAFEQP